MGLVFSNFFKQSFPPKPKWTADDIPDLTGKVILVTGGNAGVGKETVKALLKHNAKVYLAARSPDKAAKAIEELKTETGKEAIFLQLDLADLPSVRKAAAEFLSKETELHVLFNNAGVMACPIDLVTVQGYDMQIGTNVIGHHLFTQLLLPALRAASTGGGEKARVVTTASLASYLTSKFNFEWATDGPARRKAGTESLYVASKFANAVQARELARRYGDVIVATACNPGNLKTDLQRHIPSWQDWLISHTILYPAHYGAITQLWAGTSPEGAELNGKFLIPWARVGTPNPATLDPALGEKLWNWLEEECKKH